jgi:type IV pilus assembly protein PilC
MEVYTYKGISSGKYVEGEVEALNQDEASHKLKEQKIIIPNLIKSKKKKKEKQQIKKRVVNFLFLSVVFPFFFLDLIKLVMIIFCSLSLCEASS